MKKALSLLMVFVIAVMWSTNGFSAEKYVSAAAGIAWPDEMELESTTTYPYPMTSYEADIDSGLTLIGAFGCDYGDYRVEGELGYQSGDFESVTYVYGEGEEYDEPITGDLSIISLMANGYVDIDLGGVELFGTAGVGVAQVTAEDLTYDDQRIGGPSYTEHETTLAYQLGAGLAIPVADDVMLDARYRYFETTEFTVYGSQYNTSVSTHSGLLGLRINL